MSAARVTDLAVAMVGTVIGGVILGVSGWWVVQPLVAFQRAHDGARNVLLDYVHIFRDLGSHQYEYQRAWDETRRCSRELREAAEDVRGYALLARLGWIPSKAEVQAGRQALEASWVTPCRAPTLNGASSSAGWWPGRWTLGASMRATAERSVAAGASRSGTRLRRHHSPSRRLISSTLAICSSPSAGNLAPGLGLRREPGLVARRLRPPPCNESGRRSPRSRGGPAAGRERGQDGRTRVISALGCPGSPRPPSVRMAKVELRARCKAPPALVRRRVGLVSQWVISGPAATSPTIAAGFCNTLFANLVGPLHPLALS